MKKTIYSLLLGLFALTSCTQPVIDVFGSISGYVVDEDTGSAIAGARVTLAPTGLSQVTATDGEFFFDNLDAQEYTLSIKKDGYEDISQKVSVKAGMTSSVHAALNPIQPILNVQPEILDFGDEMTTLALDITNAGKGTLEWTVDEEIEWITCSVASGNTTDKVSSVVVKASREGMERGYYTETIVISSNGGSAIVKVKMSVGNSMKISASPAQLDFGPLESQLKITITNSGNTAVKYSVSSSNDWLTLSKSSASVLTTDYVDAIVSREGLGVGSYSSTIVISTADGDLTIPVSMQVAEKSAPSVTIESVDDVTYNSALVSGTIVSVGSSKVIRYGFCYSGSNMQPDVDDMISNLGDSQSPKAFKGTLTNLESATTYYVRAFAENQDGVSYSSKVLQFTTGNLPELAAIETGEASEITDNTAMVSGTVKNLGNVSRLTAYGHVWNTTGDPSLTDCDGNTDLGSCTETITYESTLTDLEPKTTYYVKAYATNEKGTVYGDVVSFTTLSSTSHPTNGLYAYYTFEDNTDNTVTGATDGSGINTSYVEGLQSGKALKFSSASSKLNIPEAMIDNNMFSISFWCKDINDGHIFDVVSSGQYYNSHIMGMRNGQLTYVQSGYYLWYRWNEEDSAVSFTHSTIDSSDWHLITMTSDFDGTYTCLCLYIDGKFLDTITLQNQGYDVTNKGTKFVFGGELKRSGYNVSLNWSGMSIDNLRVYKSKVLTAEEVEQIYEYEK